MLIIPDTLINEIMQEVINRWLIPKFEQLNLNASGEWKDNLEIKTEINKAEIWGRFYSYWLVHGRGQNHDQSDEAIKKFVGWAGSTFLKQWVKDKGLAISPYAVAHKIAKKGTEIKRIGGTDLLEVLNQPDVIQFVNERVGEYLNTQGQLMIVRDLQEILT